MAEILSNNLMENQTENLKRLLEFFCGVRKKEIFSLDVLRTKISYSSHIKNGNYNSIIIPHNYIPYYIILNEDLIHEVEFWLKETSPVPDSSIDTYFKVKEYFLKWLFSEKEVDIARYTKAINDIAAQKQDERNYPLTILLLLFYLFEGLNKNEIPQQILQCKRTIDNSRSDENLKDQLLYVMTMLSGIFYFREGLYDSSITRFSESLNFNSHGITPKYFLALAFIKKGDNDEALNQIKEIILYDLERLKYIIDQNSHELFNFYFNYPETAFLLQDNNFSSITDYIVETMNMFLLNKNISPSLILKKISELKKLDLEDIYSEGMYDSITFITNIITAFPDNQSFLFKITLFFLHEKILKIIKSLAVLIRSNYGELIERKIERIEGEIILSGKEIDILDTKIDIEKNRTNEFIARSLEDLDVYTKGIIEYNTGLLNRIREKEKKVPRAIFQKSMRAGVIISGSAVIVSFIAIISGGSHSYGSSPDFTTSVGLGILSLIISLIFSLLAMFFSIFSRNKEKKKLLEKIGQQNTIKNSESEKLQKREKDDLNKKVSKFVSEIETLKEKIKFLKLEKIRIEKEYKNDFENNIRWYEESLFRIMNE